MEGDAASPRPWPVRWLRDAAGLDQALDLTRWLFLRGLGIVYLAAFLSLAGQIQSFFASGGLIATAGRLDRIQQAHVEGLFWKLPSLFWFNAQDWFLYTAGWAGVILAVLVVLNVGTRWLLPLLWIIYLSFINVGEPFYPFQWDQLLLETGFLAIFVAIPRRASLIMVWLLRWLAFRLMFLNGVVKVMAVDPSYLDGASSPWRDGTALKYHYETQPLPTMAAWYFHQAPLWFHQFSTYFTVAVELIAPFLIFLGRWPRLVGAVLMGGIHVMILITGSHGFYNWLSLVIFIPLLDDGFYRYLFPVRLAERIRARAAVPVPAGDGETSRRVPPWVAPAAWGILAAWFVWLSIGASAGWVWRSVNLYTPWFRGWVEAANAVSTPWHLSSGYGAFARMTLERPEVVIAGSNDGVDWKEYGLFYKPGRLDRAPVLAAPHHPRLDWQLWFTALGQPSPWLVGVAHGLLTGSPAILRLVQENPFPDKPPRYVRFILYRYRFTDSDEAAKNHHWWKREFMDYAGPVLTLTPDGKLTTD